MKYAEVWPLCCSAGDAAICGPGPVQLLLGHCQGQAVCQARGLQRPASLPDSAGSAAAGATPLDFILSHLQQSTAACSLRRAAGVVLALGTSRAVHAGLSCIQRATWCKKYPSQEPSCQTQAFPPELGESGHACQVCCHGGTWCLCCLLGRQCRSVTAEWHLGRAACHRLFLHGSTASPSVLPCTAARFAELPGHATVAERMFGCRACCQP